jgi:hypothetical protein
VSTRDILVDQFGPLMTYAQLALVLKRSCGGLRISMRRNESVEFDALRLARVRLGGRIYFNTESIALILTGSTLGAVE